MSVRLPVWRLNEHLTKLLRMQHLHVIGTSVPVQFLVVVTPHLEITILVVNLLKKKNKIGRYGVEFKAGGFFCNEILRQ